MPADYAINYLPAFSALQTIDLRRLVEAVRDPWHNQTLIQVGDVFELEGAEAVELRPWQAFTVPAGMRHRPVAPARSAVLMIEKAGVVATGD